MSLTVVLLSVSPGLAPRRVMGTLRIAAPLPTLAPTRSRLSWPRLAAVLYRWFIFLYWVSFWVRLGWAPVFNVVFTTCR